MVGGEDFALDLSGLHDILGEHAQRGLAAHLETQGLHAAEQLPLGVACVREKPTEAGVILLELRPFGALPDEHGVYSAHCAVNIALNLRIGKYLRMNRGDI